MVVLLVNCVVVGEGSVISILIEDWNTVALLEQEIKDEIKDDLEDVDDYSLQLFLAKKEDGAWLDGAEAAAVTVDKRGNLQGFEQMDPLLWLKDANYFGENFTPGENQVHVLLVVPDVESKRPESEETQRQKLLNAFEWREPMRLCTSEGQDWKYQGAPELVAELAQPLVAHYDAWKLGYPDKQSHALNLVMDGRGTGKSRMLDEMKGLLCKAAKQSQQQELEERMENAYVFRVTFEGGTSTTGNLFDSKCPEFDVSYRMLYQLAKDRIEWPKFVDQLVESYPSLFLCIEEVMEILATLENIDNMKDMTVILCVDGLQELVYDGTKSCAFYRVLATICGFLNSSRAFAVCVCSATMEIPVERTLSYSSQRRVYLSPPALRGEDVLKPRTNFEKRLVDEMGGHGRALETLASVLRQYTEDELEQTEPSRVFDHVYKQLRLQYGEIFASPFFQDPANCQAVITRFGPRRRYGLCECVVPGMTVDRLRSFGMFRLNPDGTLDCAMALLLMLLRTHPEFQTM